MPWKRFWERATGREQNSTGWKRYTEELQVVNRRRTELRQKPDDELRGLAPRLRETSDPSRVEGFALACEAARRTLGLDPFDVQVIGGLILADGKIAELQTGEGKTLTATMPAFFRGLGGEGVHVLTANDYLARRDAEWMGEVYRFLGLTVGWVEQGMDAADRRRAYSCDVTYGAASEVGFDFLRDRLRRCPDDLVQRRFHYAIVDEVDSILIDEARIPLVIAGGENVPAAVARDADKVVHRLVAGTHFERVDRDRRVVLTEAGAARVEALLACGNLFSPENDGLLAALSQALHAHELLTRDTDYLVRNGTVELIDAYKGRVARDRRWPEGLQAAVEAKEGIEARHAGWVLGSITMQNLIGLYPHLCGMTGTAATQAVEFREMYGLEVVVVPTNRPVIRVDHPEIVLATEQQKFVAVVEEIRRENARGRPVLVGTASVAASERLGRILDEAAIPHAILNARNEAAEAAVVRQAGTPGAVTISTNMAGRGTDILLGGDPPAARNRVRELGGLYVIGTNRHESRRIDSQLRGRVGRQGDPGESRFFVSLEDELFAQYGLNEETDIDHAQRVIEGQQLAVRMTLRDYERIIELQRRILDERRRRVLLGDSISLVREELPGRYEELCSQLGAERVRRLERDVTLARMDEWWSRYLEEVALAKEDVTWVSASRRPLHEFQRRVSAMFDELGARIAEDVLDVLREENPEAAAGEVSRTGATWTYQTSDEVFPDMMTRFMQGISRRFRKKAGSNLSPPGTAARSGWPPAGSAHSARRSSRG